MEEPKSDSTAAKADSAEQNSANSGKTSKPLDSNENRIEQVEEEDDVCLKLIKEERANRPSRIVFTDNPPLPKPHITYP